jgi:hypothetical protein
MHEYDTAFKITLQRVDVVLREILGTTITRWRNVEFPEVRSVRADLLGDTEEGELVHIELQAQSERQMAARMLEYCADSVRVLGRVPYQVVLYVGDEAPRMETKIQGPMLNYEFRLVDVRDLDGERLLASPVVDDNIVGLLTRLKDVRGAVRQLLSRIGALEPGEREEALARLLVVAGLRKALGTVIEEEAKKMPILNDILDHEVIGREYKRGELTVLRRLIAKRFGSLPPWVEERLSKLSAKELEDLSVRVLDVTTIEELLQ